MTDSNATEHPRRALVSILKERGVDMWNVDGITFWNCDDGRECLAYEYESDGVPKLAMKVLALTPEQAVAATLGGETCEMETDWEYLQDGIPNAPEDTWAYRCGTCGWSFRYDRGIKPKFCPECGAKVKED